MNQTEAAALLGRIPEQRRIVEAAVNAGDECDPDEEEEKHWDFGSAFPPQTVLSLLSLIQWQAEERERMQAKLGALMEEWSGYQSHSGDSDFDYGKERGKEACADELGEAMRAILRGSS